MVRVSFTQNLQRHVSCGTREVAGGTVREVLNAAFAVDPAIRGYVLDERGAVRRHVVVFVDGRPIKDRDTLSDPVADGGEVYVMQALSGG